jgi:hypothetical protein
MAATPAFDVDVEAGRTTQASPPMYTEGYLRLAFLMGLWPEFATFRRFGWLSALNLMRLQSELAKLERDLQSCQTEDGEEQKGLGTGSTYSTNFDVLAHAPDSRQRKVMEDSMVKLQEYSKHVLLFYNPP